MKRSKLKEVNQFWRHDSEIKNFWATKFKNKKNFVGIPSCAKTQGRGFRRKRGTPALTLGINLQFSPRSKRSQMKLSFGMIFSIILIVIFIAFAFYAINKFIGIQDSVKIGRFVDKLQSDIDKIWKGSQGTQKEEYSIPSKIEDVCFVDYSYPKKGQNQDYYQKLKQAYYGGENLIFYPVGSGEGLDSFEIIHIDIEEMTKNENPFCIKNVEGKINIVVGKNFGENLVTIIRQDGS